MHCSKSPVAVGTRGYLVERRTEDRHCTVSEAATTLPSQWTNEPSTEEMSSCRFPVKMVHSHRPS
jgi:hypothetical protein